MSALRRIVGFNPMGRPVVEWELGEPSRARLAGTLGVAGANGYIGGHVVIGRSGASDTAEAQRAYRARKAAVA